MLCPCSAVLLLLTGQSWGARAGFGPYRGACQTGGVTFLPSVAPSLQATEIGEPRGQDRSGKRGPLRRAARAPRPDITERGEHLRGAGLGVGRGLS